MGRDAMVAFLGIPTLAPACYNANIWNRTSRFMWPRWRRVYALQKANSPTAGTIAAPTAATMRAFRQRSQRFLPRASAPVGSGVMSLYRGNSSVYSSTNVTSTIRNCGEYFPTTSMCARRPTIGQSWSVPPKRAGRFAALARLLPPFGREEVLPHETRTSCPPEPSYGEGGQRAEGNHL